LEEKKTTTKQNNIMSTNSSMQLIFTALSAGNLQRCQLIEIRHGTLFICIDDVAKKVLPQSLRNA
jgi:hypothetical protein